MIVLKRRSGPWADEPLTWLPVKRPDGTFTADVMCFNGHAGLIDEHAINDDGSVTPSVVCTQEGCTWHEHIQLAGWLDHYATEVGKAFDEAAQRRGTPPPA